MQRRLLEVLRHVAAEGGRHIDSRRHDRFRRSYSGVRDLFVLVKTLPQYTLRPIFFDPQVPAPVVLRRVAEALDFDTMFGNCFALD